MSFLILASLIALGVASPTGYRDELDLSPSSLFQTARNAFGLPRFLGGGKDVDSDVRFGWSSSDEDRVGRFGNRGNASPWSLESLLSSGSRDSEYRENRGVRPSFRKPVGVFDPPSTDDSDMGIFKRRDPTSVSRRSTSLSSEQKDPDHKSENELKTDNLDVLGFISKLFDK